jgi:hypothetical protein
MMTHPDHIQFLAPATLAPTPGYSQVVKVTGGQMIYLAGHAGTALALLYRWSEPLFRRP